MLFSPSLSVRDGDLFDNDTYYRTVLQYITIIRSDLYFAVNKFCQFISVSRLPHWLAIKCIPSYI